MESTLDQAVRHNDCRWRQCVLLLAALLTAGVSSVASAQTDSATGNEAPTDTEATALDEGPIHEAFAEPVTDGAQRGPVVPQEPPAPIEEIPPEVKPEGENVEWIPGYWMWVDERNDFVWVSGLWRAVPPGRMWMPGSWRQVENGYEWVSGFWTDANQQQVEYLPPPPETLEEGPTSPAPSEQHFWTPGCWTYQSDNYAWRPGYWQQGRQNWVYVPSRYVHTPRGSVFVNGYWDYPPRNRGLLYAPVYWRNGLSRTAGYRYQPNRVINTAALLGALFINNDRGYYYYGRGYGNRNNFYPWYSAGRRGGAYSPFYNYYAWQYGRDSRGWADRFAWDGDRARRGDREDRRLRGDRTDRGREGVGSPLIAPLDDIRDTLADVGLTDQPRDRAQDGAADGADAQRDQRDRGVRLRNLSDGERQQLTQRAQRLREFGDARAQFETQQTASADGARAEAGAEAQAQTRQESTFDLSQSPAAEALRQQGVERTQRFRQRVMRPVTGGEQAGQSDQRAQRFNPLESRGGPEAQRGERDARDQQARDQQARDQRARGQQARDQRMPDQAREGRPQDEGRRVDPRDPRRGAPDEARESGDRARRGEPAQDAGRAVERAERGAQRTAERGQQGARRGAGQAERGGRGAAQGASRSAGNAAEGAGNAAGGGGRAAGSAAKGAAEAITGGD